MSANEPNPNGEGKTLDELVPEEPGTVEGTLKAFRTILENVPFNPFEEARRGAGVF